MSTSLPLAPPNSASAPAKAERRPRSSRRCVVSAARRLESIRAAVNNAGLPPATSSTAPPPSPPSACLPATSTKRCSASRVDLRQGRPRKGQWCVRQQRSPTRQRRLGSLPTVRFLGDVPDLAVIDSGPKRMVCSGATRWHAVFEQSVSLQRRGGSADPRKCSGMCSARGVSPTGKNQDCSTPATPRRL